MLQYTHNILAMSFNDAHMALPHAKWWIKSDGVDVLEGLMESVSHKWDGDEYLGDGQLQKQYQR